MVSPTPLDHLILLRFGGIKKIEKQDSAAQCVLLLWFEQSTTTLGQKQKNTDRLFIRRSRKKIFFNNEGKQKRKATHRTERDSQNNPLLVREQMEMRER